MNCNFIRNNLFTIVENELPEAEMTKVREHIAGCTSCSALIVSFSSIMDVIEKDRKTEHNPFLATRILQKMESHRTTGDRRFLFHIPRVLQPVLAVTLVLLAVLTGFFAGRQGKNLNRISAYERNLNKMKTDLFISELNDEDKILKLYK
ncbi:MAG: zf-HC2 domain-containing protein [Bacteroidales bacterium]|jgi:hypothetical protein